MSYRRLFSSVCLLTAFVATTAFLEGDQPEAIPINDPVVRKIFSPGEIRFLFEHMKDFAVPTKTPNDERQRVAALAKWVCGTTLIEPTAKWSPIFVHIISAGDFDALELRARQDVTFQSTHADSGLPGRSSFYWTRLQRPAGADLIEVRATILVTLNSGRESIISASRRFILKDERWTQISHVSEVL